MVDRMRRILASISLLLALVSAAAAQTFPGQLPAWNLFANPSASSADGQSATITQMLDGAFCSTANAIIQRGASTWSCSNSAYPAILRPETYGVKWDGATDDTLAWNALATAINATGGGVIIVCPSGLTSMVWKNAGGVPAGNLMTLSVPGVTFFWNGSKLISDQTAFSGSNVNAVFQLNTGVTSFESHDLNYTASAWAALDANAGARAYYVANAASNIRIYGTVMNGGRSFVEIAAGTWQTQ